MESGNTLMMSAILPTEIRVKKAAKVAGLRLSF
jgi:hypothetical protein